MRIKNQLRLLTAALALLAILTCLNACKQNVSAPQAEKPAPQSPNLPTPLGGTTVPTLPPREAGGISWTVPPGWQPSPPRQMRVATYRIRAIAGDPEDAECAVYFFGTGQGGTVEANLDRWTHQFAGPDGQSPVQRPKIEKRDIASLKVSTIAVSGTYLGGGGMMGQQQQNKPNYRMRAAIVEAPQGLVFFKLTGPLNTVAAAENDFISVLQSLQKQ